MPSLITPIGEQQHRYRLPSILEHSDSSIFLLLPLTSLCRSERIGSMLEQKEKSAPWTNREDPGEKAHMYTTNEDGTMSLAELEQMTVDRVKYLLDRVDDALARARR